LNAMIPTGRTATALDRPTALTATTRNR
jgi:hypothetical protein